MFLAVLRRDRKASRKGNVKRNVRSRFSVIEISTEKQTKRLPWFKQSNFVEGKRARNWEGYDVLSNKTSGICIRSNDFLHC